MRRYLVPLAVLAVLAAGCTDDDPAERTPDVDADGAQGRYGALAAEVAEDLAVATGSSASGDGRAVYAVGDDGICEFWSQEFDLPVWFGQDVDWDDVRVTIEEAVPDGWTLGDDLDIPGGYSGFDVTEDATGAVIEVRAKGGSTVRVVAPVEGDCADEASPSPVPTTF